MEKTSLIISTYNRPDALSLCLKSVKQQSVLPGEVLVADDGSGPETKLLIEQFQKDFPVPLVHTWHPDEGFRLAAIRNRAIAAARYRYIIQIDGDLILHPEFINDHIHFQKQGSFVAGSRVMLDESTTKQLLQHQSTDISKFRKGFSMNDLRSGLLRKFLAKRYKTSGKYKYYVKGCNMAFFKADLEKVNGYNEAFEGWGSEDREIASRLIHAGIEKRSIKMGAVCYHLFHPLPSREQAKTNEAKMFEAVQKNSSWAEDGLNKYLSGS